MARRRDAARERAILRADMGLFDRLRKKEPAAQADAEVDALLERLRDRDWQARRDAAVRLGELGARSHKAVPALEEAIADEHGDVCLAASDALSKIRKDAL